MAYVVVVVVILAVVVAIATGIVTPNPAFRTQHHPLHLLDDGTGNESLIVDGTLAGDRVLFLLDTAYAGAPVLSIS